MEGQLSICIRFGIRLDCFDERWSDMKQREPGKYDGIEQFNFYSPQFADHEKVPGCIRPFMDEITAFCEVSYCRSRRLMTLSVDRPFSI